MKENILGTISTEIETLVKKVSPFLVHIGSDELPYRTGMIWNDRHILTTAVSAQEGEPVPVLFADGKTSEATVRAFDSRTGLALLRAAEPVAAPGWEGETARLGGLAVTVAFPSPAGPEALLSMARCVGEDYFQTDSNAFPGFSGAAVIGSSGKLWGVITSNAGGNRGQALPFGLLEKLARDLETDGSRKRYVLGVRTQPAEGGLLVAEVAPQSAARAAGLLVGDILTGAAGGQLRDPFDLLQALEKGDGKIELTLTRGGKEMKLSAEPHAEPETTTRRWNHRSCCGR